MQSFMPAIPERSGTLNPPRENFAQLVHAAWRNLPAYLPLLLVLLAMMVEAMLSYYFGNQDLNEYQCYAGTFWFGAKALHAIPASQCLFIPQVSQFHSLPLEYPPLALAVFSLPLLGPLSDYPFGFTLVMALTMAMIYLLLLKNGPRKAATFFMIGLLAGGLGTGLTRFDMAPAALTLLCLFLAKRKHWTWASVTLALGVLIKIYPIVLFPLLFLAEQRNQAGVFDPQQTQPDKTALNVFRDSFHGIRRWRWKNVLVFAGIMVGVTAISWGISPTGAFSWLYRLSQRPFEAESTGSALLWLVSLPGHPDRLITSFGSLNLLSPVAGTISLVFSLLLAAGYFYIVIQQYRGRMSFFQACVAALMLLIATGKVLSPQYLLWLMPFMAIGAPGNRRLWLAWIGICLLTTIIYPFYYGIISLSQAGPIVLGFMLFILLRDVMLVGLTITYLFNFFQIRNSNTQPSTTGGRRFVENL